MISPNYGFWVPCLQEPCLLVLDRNYDFPELGLHFGSFFESKSTLFISFQTSFLQLVFFHNKIHVMIWIRADPDPKIWLYQQDSTYLNVKGLSVVPDGDEF